MDTYSAQVTDPASSTNNSNNGHVGRPLAGQPADNQVVSISPEIQVPVPAARVSTESVYEAPTETQQETPGSMVETIASTEKPDTLEAQTLQTQTESGNAANSIQSIAPTTQNNIPQVPAEDVADLRTGDEQLHKVAENSAPLHKELDKEEEEFIHEVEKRHAN